jgi:hypothetical protein
MAQQKVNKKTQQFPPNDRFDILLDSPFTHTWDNACQCYHVQYRIQQLHRQKVSQLLFKKESWEKNNRLLNI